LEREPFSSAYSPAEALDVSPATVLNRLYNSLGMKNFSSPLGLSKLTDDLRQMGMIKSGELLHPLEAIQ
jgi:hypothetical protein